MKTVFIRLLMHLTIAVVLITLLVGALVYRNTDVMLKEEVLGANAELLAQTQKIVEQALGEVQQMASSLAINTDVQKSVWLPWNLEEEYRFLQNTSNLFSERIHSSNYLHSIYLYSSVNNKLISPSGIAGMDDFPNYEHLREFIEGRETMSWGAGYWSDEHKNPESVLQFYFSVPLHNVEKKGALLIHLKEDVLYNAVVNTNNRKLGNVAILNEEGAVLSYKDKSMLLHPFADTDIEQIRQENNGSFVESIGGKKMLVSYLTSTFNGWIYVTLNPCNEVFKRSNDIIRITLLISLLGLGLGIALMVLVSRNYYKPVQKMVQALSSNLEQPFTKALHRDEFSYISESIDHLFNENEEFKTKFYNSELVLREHALIHLLSGSTASLRELERQLDYYGIPLQPEHFIVIVLRLYLNKGAELAEPEEKLRNLIYFQIRMLCEETMADHGPGVYIPQFHKQDVMIVNTGTWGDREQTINKAKELAFQVKRKVSAELPGVSLTIGIGGSYTSLSEIYLSYNEAVEVLQYERLTGSASILSIHDLQINHMNRNRIMNFRHLVEKAANELKTGRLEASLAAKDELIQQLSGDSSLGLHHKNLIVTDLLHALMTLRAELLAGREGAEEDDGLVYEFSKLQNLEDIRLWFDKAFIQTSEALQDKRENKNVEMIGKLAAYVRENYREPLSLQMLADLAFMNSQYLSKLFKEVTGQTFIDYLTDIRVREACHLLRETQSGINEIAAASGFGQKQNLIRTIKKQTGLTPTEYRKRNAIERLNSEKPRIDTDPIH
ncbi:helix-turn-helix domain-containing protein [Paenibacillus sp. J2TS4]|uniref:helix-turn-helix domain-containing protein n=1 Tax=Paenibacillus sp. J2TS4 TaxID=2807194 RepID=UPI001AFE1E08|nr:helix-turn-helix domain-containing protein [Paenibacillus sp. J2TS4]GIP34870.1 hypothetical protein J2TS4_40800 [Paenibacillus sp. J2TS4]